MTSSKFVAQLAEVLELQSETGFNEQTNLRSLEEYDSIAVLSVIAMINENFGITLTAAQLEAVTTVQSLIDVIGTRHFEG